MNDDEKICPKCAETVKAAAVVCKHCGYNFETKTSPESAVEYAKKKELQKSKGCLVVLGVIVAIGIIGSLAGGDGTTSRENDAAQPPGVPVANVGAASPITTKAEDPEVGSLTASQQNAARSAEQYLSMSGFSRVGLIHQLSSDSGDGYAHSDAVAAVDSLNVDWNAQAARSAQQYLNMTGFSCKGLIEQLSSSAGDNYTVAQARHGAEQAGAC